MDFKSAVEYAAFRGALALLSRLPVKSSESMLRRAARLAGGAMGVRRQVVEKQLRSVYPELTDAELVSLRTEVYDALGRTAAEVLCTDLAKTATEVEVVPGWDSVDRALAGGKGGIVATGHLGNFELGGAVLAGRYPLLDVVKTQRNRAFDRFLQRRRHALGIETVTMDHSIRPVLRQLRRGGLVSLLVDQDAGGSGVATDFLGLPASTWPGAARIALHTGCPVIPMAITRTVGGGHRLRIGEPVQAPGEGENEVRVREYTSRISRAFEQYVLAEPAQWFWVHRRWKGAAEAKGTHEKQQV